MPPEWKAPGVVKAEIQPNRTPVSSSLRQYALFQLPLCIAGLIAMLVYKDVLSDWEILLYSAIGIAAISNCAMIFNDNIGENFTKWESVRLVTALVLVFATMMVHSKIYLLPIVLFLLISLLWPIRSSKRISEERKDPQNNSGKRIQSANS